MMVRIVIALLICASFVSSAEARGRRGWGGGGGGAGGPNAAVALLSAPQWLVDQIKAEGETPAEQAVLALVNAERTHYGLAPVAIDRQLLYTARYQTWWMATNSSMTHGQNPSENIAMGQTSPAHVMHSWMTSSGHRANILNPRWRKIGIGAYHNTAGTIYWTQQFQP